MSIKEANKLIDKYIKLRTKAKNTNDKKILNEFKQHKNLCLQKFKYLVLMRTSKYKNFSNYDDLNQEGLEAILKGLNSYNPKRGNIFWWLHKYVETRVARCANLHTTIRFPLKYTKSVTPHRESSLPLLIDQTIGQYDALERHEILALVQNNLNNLSSRQKRVVKLLFGMDDQSPQSMTKVCKQLRMSKNNCVELLSDVFDILKKNIKL